jgi:hypothetical protein
MKVEKFSTVVFENRKQAYFASQYSKFKYGSKKYAREFGHLLGLAFAKSDVYANLLKSYDLKKIKVAVSAAPYKFVPTASFHLKDYFLHKFNRIHVASTGNSVEDFKIFRGHSYDEDYGLMSSEERDKAITADDFYLDLNFIKDKILISVDDIRITGSHERRINGLLAKHGFKNEVIHIYFAELIDQSDPTIESYLNLYSIKSLNDVEKIIVNDEFLFNTRVIKYILSAEHGQFKDFIRLRNWKFLDTLLHYAYGNEYFKTEKYIKNLHFLEESLKEY